MYYIHGLLPRPMEISLKDMPMQDNDGQFPHPRSDSLHGLSAARGGG